MCRVSVIVPVYQVEAYLAKCLDSILAQTFTDFELILVDDGTRDDCPRIMTRYAAWTRAFAAFTRKTEACPQRATPGWISREANISRLSIQTTPSSRRC